MKIMHVTKKYPNVAGGDATGVFNLEKEQTELGHEVFILTTNCDETIDKPNVIKFGIRSKPQDWDNLSWKRFISTWMLIFSAFKMFNQIKPDVVHSHSAELGFILSFPCRYYNIPLINQCRGVNFPYPQNTLIRRIVEKFCLKYGRFDKIITVDANSLEAFEKSKIKNVIYIPNGLDFGLFNQNTRKVNKKIIFLFVGRVEEQKGISDLFKAVNLLKNKDYNFEVHLLGECINLKYYHKLIKHFGIKNYIKFLGKKNFQEVVKNYFNSDIFVLPSHQEGFPNTLLEAWGAKLPVIITNVGGISKICTDRENALIVPPKDSEALAKAMLILIKNPDLRKKLGRNGRRLVEEKYSWDKITKKIERIYKELVK